MPRRSKINAGLIFMLALLLYLFFQISKHQPALAQVNAFAEDPYDAVGSFGVQFALVTALLSLVRAFRPYQSNKAPRVQEGLLARSVSITCISAGVVLAADVIAMIRYPTLWIGSPARYILAELLGGMALLTALIAWLLRRSMYPTHAQVTRSAWIKTSSISIAGILILAFYPENWRQSTLGALFTASIGMVLFFVAVWSWEIVTTPAPQAFFEDFIDDLASLYHWLKAHMSASKPLFTAFERTRDWPIVRWLNPRKHSWNGIILLGVFMGGMLALVEIGGEGGPGPHQAGRLITVVAVFVGLEGAGVLLGYALLAQPLGLFRRVSKQNSPMPLEQ
jgi:hypothetical protein